MKAVIIGLIEQQGANSFYVGNHGNFDRFAASVLEELKLVYPHIEYRIVLAYLPACKDKSCTNTVFPEGIEAVPKRFAINFRNRWMINQSDTVVAYITHSFGGASKFVEIARKKNKRIINIAFK